MSVPVSPVSSLTWIERPGRELVRLAWPITVSMVSFSTMTLASTAFVAHIGGDGLGGIVGFAVVCFGIGLLRGAKTLVSQAVGAGRHERIPELLGAALGVAVAFGVVGVIAGHAIAPLLAHLSASPRAGEFAAQ